MDKMTVVIDKKGISLSLEAKALRIDCPSEPMQKIPLGMVGQVIVYGNPDAGSSVWRRLAEMGIHTLLLPTRGEGEPAWIGPGLSTSVMVRIAQFQAWSDNKLKSEAIVWLLKKKFGGLIQLADILGIKSDVLHKSISNLNEGTNVDTFMGIEGAAARWWFKEMASFLDPKWKFQGRNRRPPKDHVNALLSLGYTLLFSEIRNAIHRRGLDPCIGFLHVPQSGRDSLVLDLAEPFRPGVDAFVLNLVDEVLNVKHFITGKNDGCFLSKEGRGYFYPAWEAFKQAWPISDNDGKKKVEFLSLTSKVNKLTNDFVRSWKILNNDDDI